VWKCGVVPLGSEASGAGMGRTTAFRIGKPFLLLMKWRMMEDDSLVSKQQYN